MTTSTWQPGLRMRFNANAIIATNSCIVYWCRLNAALVVVYLLLTVLDIASTFCIYCTALHCAASRGHAAVIVELLGKSSAVPVDARDRNGCKHSLKDTAEHQPVFLSLIRFAINIQNF